MFFAGASTLKAGRHDVQFQTTLPQQTLYATPGDPVAFRGDVVGLRVHPDLKPNARSHLTLAFYQKEPLVFTPLDMNLSPQTTLQQTLEQLVEPANSLFQQTFQDYRIRFRPPYLDRVQDTWVLRLPPRSNLSSDYKPLWTFMGFRDAQGTIANPTDQEDVITLAQDPVSRTRMLQDMASDQQPTTLNFNLKFTFLPIEQRVQGSEEVRATPRRLAVELENALDQGLHAMGFRTSPLVLHFDGRNCTLRLDPDKVFWPGQLRLHLQDDFALYFWGPSKITFDSGQSSRQVWRVLDQTTDLLDDVYPVKVVTDSFSHNMAFISGIGFTTLMCQVLARDTVINSSFVHPLHTPSFTIKVYNDRSDPVSFPFDVRVCIDIDYMWTHFVSQ